MIKSLKIRNFQLLKNIDLDLSKGFTAISGETGTGKSMIIDALLLLFGKRAEKNNPKQKSIIEIIFLLDSGKKKFFTDNNLDFNNETIIRREINKNGKSRAFINDTPVLINILTKFSKEVIEIFTQNQSLLLIDSKFQYKLIDEFSNSLSELKKYQFELSNYNKLKQELKIIHESEGLSNSEFEFLRYQNKEINEVNLQIDEKTNLEKKIFILENAEDILSIINEKQNLISGEDFILDNISQIQRDFDSFDYLNEISNRLNSIWIELNDINSELSTIKDNINTNPKLLEKYNNRLNLINNLLNKHNVNSINELLVLNESIITKINNFNLIEEKINDKKSEITNQYNILTNSLNELKNKRNKNIPILKENIETSLMNLGISHPRFDVLFSEKQNFDEYGNNNISFLFSANKGSPLIELSKVASGGELSRLMLSIKYASIINSSINTIIFDEIDSGVSGRIANMMGDMMLKISKKVQVLSITHLPQVASRANEHLKVKKQIINGNTSTNIFKLKKDDRIEELAKLLSGKTLTKAALNNAIELLNQ